jgi:hypothetical protein
MDLFNDRAQALHNVIAAQQEVIGAWEAVFSSVENTILNLVKLNIELKVKLMREKDPDMIVPENIYHKMDLLKTQYHRGDISALAYFEGLDTLLSAIVK